MRTISLALILVLTGCSCQNTAEEPAPTATPVDSPADSDGITDSDPVDDTDTTADTDPTTDTDPADDTDILGDSSCSDFDTGAEARAARVAFEETFATGWCERWTECGFQGGCAQTQPWLTHYENNDGTMEFDCEPAGCQRDWDLCMERMQNATCSEVQSAAQLGTENGPWIDLCYVLSCV